MARSRAVGGQHARGLVLVLVACALLVASAERSVARADDAGPYLTNAHLSTTSLPFGGGQVTVTVDAVDESGIFMMYASVNAPPPDNFVVQMLYAGGDSYSAVIDIPANFTDQPLSWGVSIDGTDGAGQISSILAGEINIDAQPQFDEAPAVFDPTVTPRALASTGGPVTIHTHASDNRGLSEVHATVTLPGGATADVALDAISADEFEGVYIAPGNATSTLRSYGVTVTATDDIGQQDTEDAGAFTVAAKPVVQPGKLSLSPGRLELGSVNVGRSALRWVVIRNNGPRAAAPIQAVAGAGGAGFSVVGAGPAGLPLSIPSGSVRVVAVKFAPAARGRVDGLLTVSRADGQQPGLTVKLAGRGT